ncbi:ABC transporter ATP-binding protein [uncultured Shimia sp.]|uniref:ABC transporter ATP-binding protein n=1 Tax=uncultured Shimia sp. TaxID=573152 RepID=UPI002625986C|nr:ABC transporter ATP-binding protein [uncultured Shimia sp.]
MFENYRLIWRLLISRERRNFLILILLTILMSIFEIAGVAAILPFLQLVGDPAVIETNSAVKFFADVTKLSETREITIGFGLAVLLMLVFGMFVRALGTYLQIRFSMMRAYSIGMRLLRTYLLQPYVWFLGRNTAEFGQNILSEVDLVVRQCLLPAILLISNGLISFLIFGLLFFHNPLVAASAAILLSGVYLAVYLALNQKLSTIGKLRLDANNDRFQVVQEIGGSIKELKVLGLEDEALIRFQHPASTVAQTQSSAQILGKIPRFALEAVIYGGFVFLILVMFLFQGQESQDLLPLFGLLGLSGMKLFPALQQIYVNLTLIRFSSPALRSLHENVVGLATPVSVKSGLPIGLSKRLELENLCFTYPQAEQPSIYDINVSIPAGSSLGIVGGTGAGKTTLVNILLGLLTPDRGEVRVDGILISDSNCHNWQQSLGYVPQEIFLSDNTIAANIAFGLPSDKIDHVIVEQVAKISSLHDFITEDLPQGYNTRVGERGVRLSGGQRQRIGIARALYHNPDILVLDEATSALDNLTERAVMKAVNELENGTTVIKIAHRLSTVRNCDTIILLEKGQVAAEGSYDELMSNSLAFRKLATS